MMKSIRVFLSPFLGGAILLGISAATVAAAPSDRKESVTDPIFNAETNSYFQLFRHPRRGGAYSWNQANAQAIRKFYRGQRGRLAMVRDPKILQFVRANFSFEGDTWIGVRFFCKYSKLLWTDGKLQGPKQAGMWHSQWYRTNIRCEGKPYMPVYLTTQNSGGVFWQASGPEKGHYYFLVEFPSVKKSDNVSQNSKAVTEPSKGSGTE